MLTHHSHRPKFRAVQNKNQIGLRRLRLRGLKFVREQFFLAATAQNIERLVRVLGQRTTAVLARKELISHIGGEY
ncbi:MAG: transposase [Terriglobales bacterium]